jgi:hypothetical protein
MDHNDHKGSRNVPSSAHLSVSGSTGLCDPPRVWRTTCPLSGLRCSRPFSLPRRVSVALGQIEPQREWSIDLDVMHVELEISPLTFIARSSAANNARSLASASLPPVPAAPPPSVLGGSLFLFPEVEPSFCAELAGPAGGMFGAEPSFWPPEGCLCLVEEEGSEKQLPMMQVSTVSGCCLAALGLSRQRWCYKWMKGVMGHPVIDALGRRTATERTRVIVRDVDCRMYSRL